MYIKPQQVKWHCVWLCGGCYGAQQVGVGLMLDSDRYIIDVDQLDCDVGGANHISSNSATPIKAHVTSTGDAHPLTSDHMIPVSDYVTNPRSGGDIIKLLGITSSKDHMSPCPIVDSNSSSK